MVTLTSIHYELDENPEKTISRLKWAVEQVDNSWIDNFNGTPSLDTSKDWIGEIDEKNLSFSLKESSTLFRKHFYISLKGHIEQRSLNTHVNIRLGLNNFSFLLIMLLYLSTGLFIYEAFRGEDFSNYFLAIFFLLAYSLLSTFLTYRRMKRVEKKLDFLFGYSPVEDKSN